MKTSQFLKCGLGKLLGKITSEFKIKIGTRFQDDKRDITIIDREYRTIVNKRGYTDNQKWYKYKCNKCGWKEGWIVESALLTLNIGCSCCYGNTSVLGINTIYDTDPWMIPYMGEEVAKTHTHGSGDKVQVVCPDCGRIKDKKMKISNIYTYHSINCTCSDKVPYGEKIISNILNQLGLDFKTQLNKTTYIWCQDYKYDFYFKLNNKQYIIETHGIQHYKQTSRKGARTLKEEQENDRLKKELALVNGIKEENYIVIDCRESTLKCIKQHILEDETLNNLFDLSKIDWLKAEEFAVSSLVKVACEYKKYNPDLTAKEIGDIIGYHRSTITSWLKQGNKLDWCKYNATEELRKSSSKNGKTGCKPIICITTEQIFESATECARQSFKIFGIDIKNKSLLYTCNHNYKHKNHIFKFISDLTSEEYIKYDIENKLKELHDKESVQTC